MRSGFAASIWTFTGTAGSVSPSREFLGLDSWPEAGVPLISSGEARVNAPLKALLKMKVLLVVLIPVRLCRPFSGPPAASAILLILHKSRSGRHRILREESDPSCSGVSDRAERRSRML